MLIYKMISFKKTFKKSYETKKFTYPLNIKLLIHRGGDIFKKGQDERTQSYYQVLLLC